jgi:vancomycin permeability regulator SanA
LLFVGIASAVSLRPSGRLTRAVFLALFAISCANALSVFRVFHQGEATGSGLPLSCLVAVFFLALHELVRRRPDIARPYQRRDWACFGAGILTFGILLPLALVWTFGTTNYAGELVYAGKRGEVVDSAVVFGAGVYSDGTPSMALSDRTRTAIDLYKDGVVKRLYFSGGPGPGEQHEVEAMLRLALAEGVPEDACILDREGLSTAATAAHASRDLGTDQGRIYAVSHGYHLPRIELAFWEYGVDVRTVPAKETKPMLKRHFYLLREVPGFWIYWARRVV